MGALPPPGLGLSGDSCLVRLLPPPASTSTDARKITGSVALVALVALVARLERGSSARASGAATRAATTLRFAALARGTHMNVRHTADQALHPARTDFGLATTTFTTQEEEQLQHVSSNRASWPSS